MQFQSHAGSIEAGFGVQGCSNKARFNPTLVRLRPLTRSDSAFALAVFQSHAGSIEAVDEYGHLKLVIISFNPTLVRLRPRAFSANGHAQPEFQSHAGSIEAGSPWR